MDTKLTLKLDQQIIEGAKKYASEKKVSLSRIVESYFKSLISKDNNAGFEISPFVKSISTGTKIPLDVNVKDDYSDYLLKKYQ